MLSLIQYIIATVIVILFLVGFVLLSLRLRTREEIIQQPEEEVQLQETGDLPETDYLPGTDNPPKRSLLAMFKRRERRLVL
jgi:hypothetical protein